MNARDANLQILLDQAASATFAHDDPRAAGAAQLVFDRLAASVGTSVATAPSRLPVCQPHLDAALSRLAGFQSHLPEIGSAFAGVEESLRWVRRSSSTAQDQPFHDGHANAMLVGPGGFEEREDVMVGVSLVAPQVTYPDHSHPPEEVYLVLSDGEWWNTDMGWVRPGPGGLVYNPPGITHAMRAGAAPLLALWFLPL